MAIDPEFGRRLRAAKREWEMRHDRELPNQELAELVRREAGVTSLSGQAVGQWLNKGQEPSSLALLRALAAVLEIPVSRLVEDVPREGRQAPPRTTQELTERYGTQPPQAPPKTTKAASKKAANDRRHR